MSDTCQIMLDVISENGAKISIESFRSQKEFDTDYMLMWNEANHNGERFSKEDYTQEVEKQCASLRASSIRLWNNDNPSKDLFSKDELLKLATPGLADIIEWNEKVYEDGASTSALETFNKDDLPKLMKVGASDMRYWNESFVSTDTLHLSDDFVKSQMFTKEEHRKAPGITEREVTRWNRSTNKDEPYSRREMTKLFGYDNAMSP